MTIVDIKKKATSDKLIARFLQRYKTKPKAGKKRLANFARLMDMLDEQKLKTEHFIDCEAGELNGATYAKALAAKVGCKGLPEKPFTHLINYRKSKDWEDWYPLDKLIIGFDEKLPKCESILLKCVALSLVQENLHRSLLEWLVRACLREGPIDVDYLAFKMLDI